MESTTAAPALAPLRESPPQRGALLVVSPPADGATNMAVDAALLRRARETGETVYRVYGWSRPTVSLGRNQPARGCYDLALAAARGIDFVRRPTGGRAILHHREITYSVTGPISAFGSLPESYRRINRLLLEALRALGVDARQAQPSGRSPAPSLAPCFDAPVAGELVAQGRKLVGSAQVRDGNAFLQHGSVLVDDDQHLLTELLLRHETSLPPATMRALTGRSVTREEFSTALANAVAAHEEAPPRRFDLDPTVLDDVRSLIHTRFAAADWTWRR